MKKIPLLLLVFALSACGFQLRGTMSSQLPYKSLHVALPDNAEIGVQMKRYIRSMKNTQLADDPQTAEAIFEQLYDNREKTILSLNAFGQVKEYRLQTHYGFRVVDAQGRVLVPPNEISLIRDMSYDASTVLAKDQEEALLWRDINNDLISQILRRLSIIKPQNPEQD